MALITCTCGAQLKYMSSRAGSPIRCPKCGATVDTPAPAGAPAQPLPPKPAAAPPPVPQTAGKPAKPDAPPAAVPLKPAGPTRFCNACAFPIKPGHASCTHCGARVETAEEREEIKERMAIEGMTAEAEELGQHSLIWTLICFFCFPPLMIVGVVKAIQSLRASKEGGVRKSGMAIASLCIAGVWVLFFILALLIFALALSHAQEMVPTPVPREFVPPQPRQIPSPSP